MIDPLGLLPAIARGQRAWSTPEALAMQVRAEADQVLDELASLDAAGWIDVWELPEAIAVTLTPLAASRLLVEIVEVGPEERPRFRSVYDRRPLRALKVPADTALVGRKPREPWYERSLA